MPSRAALAALMAVLIAFACAADDDSSTSSNAVSSTAIPDSASPSSTEGNPPPSSTTSISEATSTTPRSDGDIAVESSTREVSPAILSSSSDQGNSVVNDNVRSAVVQSASDDSAVAGSIANLAILRRSDSVVPNPGVISGDSVASGSISSPSVVSSPQGRSVNSYGGWKNDPTMQYHIQTDEGPERYFKYQTTSGQYRKEKRLEDGTVVGTYGWVDPNGYLRLRDYVADNSGYRVLKTKMVFVGRDEPIGSAVSKAKNVPSQGGSAYIPPTYAPTTYAPPTTVYTTPAASVTSYPYSVPSNPLLYPSLANSPSNSLSGAYSQQQSYTSNPYLSNEFYKAQHQQHQQQQQQLYNSNPYYTPASDRYDNYNNYRQPQPPFPLYDGISATHNGFQYYLPRQYHEEQRQPGDQTAGSFGYIDPFGIRRVIYYNTSPGSGFVHKKNNRYVGFNATPYDPRF